MKLNKTRFQFELNFFFLCLCLLSFSLSHFLFFFFLPSNDVWKAEVSRLEGRGGGRKEGGGRFSKLKQKQGTKKKKKLGILFLY